MFGRNEKKARASRGRAFRPVLLALVIGLTCWAFWTNGQRRLDSVIDQGLFTDQTRSISAEYKAELVKHIRTFKKDFGVPLEVNILKEPPAIGAHSASRIYLDIVPSQKRAFVFLPPLVRHAVGDAFIRDLEASFQHDFASGDWRPGLMSAVLALRAKLAVITR